MKTNSAKVTIQMVSSLDGFIAKKDGDVSWMHSHDTYEKGINLTDQYIKDFLESIDCYVIGSKNYENALKLGWPYRKTPVFVISTRNLPRTKETV